MNNLRILALALLLPASLQACGQRGPLYLPDDPAQSGNPSTTSSAVDPLPDSLEGSLEDEDDMQDGDLKDEQIDDL